jgi:hypothetical protein
MSKQLHSAFEAILKMPYFKNENARSGNYSFGHEEAIAEKIRTAGFSEVKKTTYPNLKKGLLSKWAETGNDADLRKATAGLAVGTFILQPAGSQGFPDVLVKDFDDRFIAVECKSGKNGQTPMWNDNPPKPHAIYVLSSGVQNATTVFQGQDVISEEEQKLMDEQEAAIAKIVKEYNDKMKSIDKFGRGWLQKSRKQHFQGGKKEKTNFFTHHNRRQCEENVLKYVL